MRVASRIVGVALAFAGLGFLVLFVVLVAFGFGRQSVLSARDRSVWIPGSVLLVSAFGFTLAGRYFLKLDIDRLDEPRDLPASRFTAYFIAHRRELKIVAQAGLAISLVRFVAACFGVDWPGRRLSWILIVVLIGLAAIEGQITKAWTADRMDWERVPERMRAVLTVVWKAGGAAFLILLLISGWNSWSHNEIFAPIVQSALMGLIFASEALFFTYGAMRPPLTSLE